MDMDFKFIKSLTFIFVFILLYKIIKQCEKKGVFTSHEKRIYTEIKNTSAMGKIVKLNRAIRTNEYYSCSVNLYGKTYIVDHLTMYFSNGVIGEKIQLGDSLFKTRGSLHILIKRNNIVSKYDFICPVWMSSEWQNVCGEQ